MVFYFFIRKSLPKIIFSVSFYLLSPSSSLGTVAGDHLSSSSAARAGLGAAWVLCRQSRAAGVLWFGALTRLVLHREAKAGGQWCGQAGSLCAQPPQGLCNSPASRLLAVITGSAGGWHPPTAFCLVPVLF